MAYFISHIQYETSERGISLNHKEKRLADSGTLNPNPEEVTDPLFKGHVFFDAQDLIQVKYEMLRRVEKEGRSVAQVAKDFGFSRRHFYELQKQFSEAGLLGFLPEKRGPKGGHKLTSEIVAFIDTQIEKNSSLNATKLAEIVENQFNTKVHPRSIERALERKKKGQKP